MKINEFKKLEKKINSYNFNESYKTIYAILNILSYFGNIVSIFLAFFFMSKVISGSVGADNTIIVFISSIIILSGIELLKRDLFDKFSVNLLKDKGIKKSSIPLLISICLLIFASFYSSLNGAKEFSSKSKEIEQVSDNKIQLFTDSLANIYNQKILVFENQSKILFEQNLKIDDQYLNTPTNYATVRNKLREDKRVNIEQIDKNSASINDLKSELKSIIENKKSEILGNTSEKLEENKTNSFLFIILSTIIEFVILGGVFFKEYYYFRSYREFREKIDKDPNYQKWMLYDSILDVLITNDTKINQKYPPIKNIIGMCKANDIIVLPKDINDFTKILIGLGILKATGNVKYIAKTKEMAKDTLKNSYNIE
jgi:hypothetical protein